MLDPLDILSDLILWALCLAGMLTILFCAQYIAYSVVMMVFGN